MLPRMWGLRLANRSVFPWGAGLIFSLGCSRCARTSCASVSIVASPIPDKCKVTAHTGQHCSFFRSLP
ncbi:unnamed protein product [Urochloa humidicola]